MKKETLEAGIWKLEVTLYKTGTIHLSLTNKINNLVHNFLIRDEKLKKKKKGPVYISKK